ncbi:branched-chain amino acid ABC transporter permease [Petroclostridium sp. X23]|uniref:branched-chain amino acid ABC transporter permease n=1 Tax=Petroclostridium sp. X23 TaxID=3045146 RepID=UPI0024AE577B|nr:branched-chain amino acid ABC transporter permease [Petroclostridium sp. X23]WHH61262.1 branched-chain amino acid ABC transporter permease [Petroclostridium sp. X23]
MSYWIGVLTVTGIYLIAILGVSILTGFTGLFSMGHAGFMAIGAYTSALIVKIFHVPVPVGIVFGGLAAMIVGFLIGYPTLKLKGDYFVIATLGIGESVKLLVENLTITGGARGLSGVIGWTNVWNVWGMVIIVVILLVNFLNSKYGRNCIALREDELAASSVGIDIVKYKMLGMCISCVLCGLSGALLAHYMRFLHTTMFTMAISNLLIVTVILGGCGSLTGTIISALVLVPLPEFLRIESGQAWRMVIYGLLVVIVIICRPSGLMGTNEFRISSVKKSFKRIVSRGKVNG